ncbi:MAG: MFS transporter [Planctomycetota bacterium]
MPLEPSTTLKSKSYVGLILSQLLASFNDQAIHIVAIFYAGDILVRYAHRIEEETIISVVTACFITPFFIFSPLAGMLADKFSKRNILVFWKLAEVIMMGVALFGFLIPHFPGLGLASPELQATLSASIIVSVVFLMGTHSTFFIPAKYGVMPEILHPIVLSKGNGILEGTSFVSQIVGTSVGGYLYGMCKSTIDSDGHLIPGKEWLIGAILLALSVVGFVASLLMGPTPPAAPDQPVTWKLWKPIATNVRLLLRSRPLALCVLGIAFFLFMTLFLRQSLIYDGDAAKQLSRANELLLAERTQVENEAAGIESSLVGEASASQKAEFRIAMLVALVGLGVGVGSLLAGSLSGNKVELGLVPIGAVFMVIFTALLALVSQIPWLMYGCLVMIGAAAGFYIVPLYTLLQHRAPKDKKGNLVAMSNFINVTGGLVAIIFFYVMTLGMKLALGLNLTERAVQQNPELLEKYIQQLHTKTQLPSVLFLSASLLTVGMLVLLCRQLPDFFVRAILWINSQGRYHLHVDGLEHLPSDGPVLLATNCERFDQCIQVLAATDRFTRFFLIERHPDEESPWLRFMAKRTGLMSLHPETTSREEWALAQREAAGTLSVEEVVGLTVATQEKTTQTEEFYQAVSSRPGLTILPVHCTTSAPSRHADGNGSTLRRARVTIGPPLGPSTNYEQIRQAIDGLHPDKPRTSRRKRK